MIIKNLKQQAKELKNETPEKYKKIKKNQTQAKFTVISCIECIFAFLGLCEEELKWHIGEEHGKDYINYLSMKVKSNNAAETNMGGVSISMIICDARLLIWSIFDLLDLFSHFTPKMNR